MSDAPTERSTPRTAAIAILIVASAALYWLLMTTVHETGHVLGAWCTGGKVVRIVLSPLAISRTDVSPNPHPLVVVWCGPLLGTAIPALFALGAHLAKLHLERWKRAFAGFCLIANGLYLASGIVMPAGDTHDLLILGTPPWVLGAVGLPMLLAGLLLWHMLGPLWGLRASPHQAVRRWACWSVALVAVTAGAMLALQAI